MAFYPTKKSRWEYAWFGIAWQWYDGEPSVSDPIGGMRGLRIILGLGWWRKEFCFLRSTERLRKVTA